METINWSGYEWITQERWGQIHTEKSHWWYDESCVNVDENKNLNLLTKYNPKYFPELNKWSHIGVGLISSVGRFNHGTFTVSAKLPKGENLWPAFWMWSWDTWPPEIDVFEAYSNSKGSYFKPRIKSPLGFWNVQTNIHYIEKEKNKMIGGKTKFFGFKDPSKNFIKYSVEWSKNSIKFYYDDVLVRTIDDESIMGQMNNTTMNVILNNGVTAGVNKLDPPKSNFIVEYFKYEPFL